MTWLNVAAFTPCTESEGPGRRAALWVQGCAKRCPGCCNPGYLAIVERELVPAIDVLASIADAHARFGLEGVTFLGGEPMLQAQGLAVVAAGCHELGLSVMTFTGYTIAELDSLHLPGATALLAATDVLVDGPYLSDQPEQSRNWVGSLNQRFHYLSARYEPSIETDSRWARSFEVQVGVDGVVRLNGWPTKVEVASRVGLLPDS